MGSDPTRKVDIVEKKQIFREKSIERIESPEAMDDYLRVTSPGVWLLLAVVVAFLIGVVCWGFLGHLDSSTKAAVITEGDLAVCLVPESALESAVTNRTVTVNGKDYELSPETLIPEVISEETNVYWILAGNYKAGDVVYRIPLEEVPELDEEGGIAGTGVLSGSIVTEKLTPVSLLLN